MRIDGEWNLCDDGILRPIIRCEVLAGDGFWRSTEFLVDTGADRTVFSANVLNSLHLKTSEVNKLIGGVGGVVESVTINTIIRLTCDDSRIVTVRGEFSACIRQESLDISVLGRDIMGMFAAIIDQPGEVISLVREKHKYTITNH
jgi:predicted aspartyl protease